MTKIPTILTHPVRLIGIQHKFIGRDRYGSIMERPISLVIDDVYDCIYCKHSGANKSCDLYVDKFMCIDKIGTYHYYK